MEVFKTLKANGENVQISYSSEAQSWVVASKNVALLAADRKEVEMYAKNGRYQFAAEMAHVWLDILQQMSGKRRQELQEELKSKTIVGEYIGSPKHQHLVKYGRITLIFYSVVENGKDSICWPCLKAQQFFVSFGLDVVDMESLGTFSSYDLLCDKIEATFKEVSRSTIAKDEEGNVLYFQRKQEDNSTEDEVLSLAKLKTLEYRLFRKMREKLRNFYGVQRDANPRDRKNQAEVSEAKFNNLVSKFTKESKELCEDG